MHNRTRARTQNAHVAVARAKQLVLRDRAVHIAILGNRWLQQDESASVQQPRRYMHRQSGVTMPLIRRRPTSTSTSTSTSTPPHLTYYDRAFISAKQQTTLFRGTCKEKTGCS